MITVRLDFGFSCRDTNYAKRNNKLPLHSWPNIQKFTVHKLNVLLSQPAIHSTR